jgi:glycosyltransferase involved in cell wall biosynthesis
MSRVLPQVSVIIIFLNGERFLEEAIASVFGQSYLDWELILIDDGSSDGSGLLARSYASRFPERVSYLMHPGCSNRGMSASRNLGIENSRGRFIALLDDDDVWLPHKLVDQVSSLDAHPEAAMVYDATKTWHTWQPGAGLDRLERLREIGVPPGSFVRPPGLIPLFLDGRAETPGTCSVLFRREIARSVGGFEESFRGMFEDQAFFYKICLEHPVIVHGGFSALYRQHAMSSCRVAVSQGQYDPSLPNPALRTFLEWFEGYLSSKHHTDPGIRRALRRALRPFRYPLLARSRTWGARVLSRARGAVKRILSGGKY